MPYYGTITNLGKKAFVNAVKGTAPSEFWIAFGVTATEAKDKPSEATTDIEGEFQREEATATPGTYSLIISVDCTTTGVSNMIGIFDSETDGNLLYMAYYNSGALSEWPITPGNLTADEWTVPITFTVGNV